MMDPSGIAKIINEKFAQIGENVLGSVIDQIVDNSSAHLSSLNDFQSSSLMKLLRKVAGTKFLNKQPIVESDPNVYAVKDQQSQIYKSIKNSIIIGILTIKIDRAIISPMGFNRNVRNFITRDKAEWVLELTIQGQVLVSKPISTKDFIMEIPAYSPMVLSPKKDLTSAEGVRFDNKEEVLQGFECEKQSNSSERNKNLNIDSTDKNKTIGINANTGAREVLFNFNESFQITDLYSDLNIDLICRVPLECKPVRGRNNEDIVCDFYYSKNQNFDQNNGKFVSFTTKVFDEEFPTVCNNDSNSFGSNELNATNSNIPNCYAHSINNQNIKKDTNSAFLSSYKQYNVIRVEGTKPDCKINFEYKDSEFRNKNSEEDFTASEWEVLYEYMHFGKVIIPISNLIYNKLRTLPSFNNEYFNSFNFTAFYNNYIGKLFFSKKEDFQINRDATKFPSKSNSNEEWTVLGEKVNSFRAENNGYSDIDKLQKRLSDNYVDIINTDKPKMKRRNNSVNLHECSRNDNTYEKNWYHLYPKTSDITKYLKPVPGITEFGLQNPSKTLGFIQISLIFDTESKTKVSLLFNTLYNIITERPITRWIIPVTFEPQYFQRYAESLKSLLEHYPRWVPKFCFLLNFRIPRSRFDKLMILLFWFGILYVIFESKSFFNFSLILFFVLPIIISLTYRLGSQIASRIQLDYLTRVDLFEHDKRSQVNITQRKDSKNKNKHLNTPHQSSNNIFKVLQPIFSSRYYSSIAVPETKLTEEPAEQMEFIDHGEREIRNECDRVSFKEKSTTKELECCIPRDVYFGININSRDYNLQYDLSNGDGYICISRRSNNINNCDSIKIDEQKKMTFLSNANSPLERDGNIDSGSRKRNDTIKDDIFEKDVISDKNYLGQSGAVETPFGELRLGIRDQYDDQFISIFFDDQHFEPIQSQLSNLITIVELVQQSFANISTFIMKLKYSLNFEDPIIPFLTIIILAIFIAHVNLCWYLIKVILKSTRFSHFFKCYIFTNFIYWLMHKDPYNMVQFEILNRRGRVNINILKNKWVGRFFKMIHIDDLNLFLLLKSLKIYDYYPEKYIYRQICTSKSHIIGKEEDKALTCDIYNELFTKKEAIPIQILPLSIDEYLFFYSVKYIFLNILVIGSILRFFHYIFFNRISFIYRRIFLFWWYVIPDIREIEHRCITSTQLIGDLDDLIENDDNIVKCKTKNKNSYEASGFGNLLNNKNCNKERSRNESNKADLFLKQFYFGKNSGFNDGQNLVDCRSQKLNIPHDTIRGQNLINRKSLIDYILPINTKSSNSDNETNGKSTSFKYDIVENLLEGFYAQNNGKKQN